MTAPITPVERAAMRETVATLDAAWEADDPTRPLVTEHATLALLAHVASAVPRLLDALDTAEARGRMAETNLTVAGRALGKALAKGARTREENRTLRAERDEARAEAARVHEAAARVVAHEAAESDLTITRQRDRLRAREEQVRRLRAEVTRLHALVADMRAATSPAWDEDTVYDEAQTAAARVVAPYTSGPMDPLDVQVTDAVLAVVRRHLPVSGESRAQVEATALRDAATQLVAEDNTGGDWWDSDGQTYVTPIEWLRARADRIGKEK